MSTDENHTSHRLQNFRMSTLATDFTFFFVQKPVINLDKPQRQSRSLGVAWTKHALTESII